MESKKNIAGYNKRIEVVNRCIIEKYEVIYKKGNEKDENIFKEEIIDKVEKFLENKMKREEKCWES